MSVAVHERGTIIVSTDPKHIPAVYEKAYNAGNTACRRVSLENIAVIAYKSAVAAYPDKTVRCLGNRICFCRGKSVGIIVKECGVLFFINGGIDNISAVSACQKRDLE